MLGRRDRTLKVDEVERIEFEGRSHHCAQKRTGRQNRSTKATKRRVGEKRTLRVSEPQTTLTDDIAIAPAAIIG